MLAHELLSPFPVGSSVTSKVLYGCNEKQVGNNPDGGEARHSRRIHVTTAISPLLVVAFFTATVLFRVVSPRPIPIEFKLLDDLGEHGLVAVMRSHEPTAGIVTSFALRVFVPEREQFEVGNPFWNPSLFPHPTAGAIGWERADLSQWIVHSDSPSMLGEKFLSEVRSGLCSPQA